VDGASCNGARRRKSGGVVGQGSVWASRGRDKTMAALERSKAVRG
jgi:hypothetical protein